LGGEQVRGAEVDVELAAELQLRAYWSPDGCHVVVGPRAWQEDRPGRFTFATLRIQEKANTEVRIVRGPPGSGGWSLGPFNTDGTRLFVTSPQSGEPGSGGRRGQLWTLALSDNTFSLLYTQPPPQWPPYVQQGIKHEEGLPGPSYAKPPLWDNLLPSPSGELLAFNSYPPDDYMAEALWVVNLPMRQVRQLTWESSTVYGHIPVEWQRNDRSLVFLRYVRGTDAKDEYYRMRLPEDPWEQAQGGEDGTEDPVGSQRSP